MHKKISLNMVLGLLAGLVISMQACGLAYAQSPFLKKQPLTAKTVESLLQKIVGTGSQPAIWKEWGYELHNENGIISTVGRMVYRPFASSKSICRTYETIVKTPSPWATRASSKKTPGKSYEVHSFLYMTLRKNGNKCSGIEFSKYFRVDRDVTDPEVVQLLGDIGKVLENWNQHERNVQKVAPVRLDQLTRISLSEKNGKPVAKFDFMVDDIGIRTFDVSLPVKGKPHYSTAIAIP